MFDSLPPGFDLRPNDRFIVSFPRSGNTWLRLLIAHAACHSSGDIAHVDQVIPDIHADPKSDVTATHRHFGGARILKSHNIRSISNNDVVYLFRDPADSLVSYFFFFARYKNGKDLEHFMELGVDKFCIENLPSLKNHLSYALDDRRVGRSMFLSYESLLQDPAASLTAALNFLGLTVSPESVIDAIDVNRFDRLQQRELASLDRPFPFFREGKAGGGKRRLDSDTLERITAAAGPLYEAARQREPDGITSPAGASSPSARLLA